MNSDKYIEYRRYNNKKEISDIAGLNISQLSKTNFPGESIFVWNKQSRHFGRILYFSSVCLIFTYIMVFLSQINLD